MEIDLYFHVNKEEDQGLGAIEETEKVIRSNFPTLERRLSEKEQEMVNGMHAYEYIKNVQQVEKENSQFLDTHVLKDVHKLILKDIDLGKRTKAGCFSD